MKQTSTILLENSKGVISNSTPTNNISEILKNSTTLINPQQDNEQETIFIDIETVRNLIGGFVRKDHQVIEGDKISFNQEEFVEAFVDSRSPYWRLRGGMSGATQEYLKEVALHNWIELKRRELSNIGNIESKAHIQGTIQQYLDETSKVNQIINSKLEALSKVRLLMKLFAYEGLGAYNYVLSRQISKVLKIKEWLKDNKNLKISDIKAKMAALKEELKLKCSKHRKKEIFQELSNLGRNLHYLEEGPKLIKEYEKQANRVKENIIEAGIPEMFPAIVTPKGTIRKTFKAKLQQKKHWTKPIFVPKTEADKEILGILNCIAQVPSMKIFAEWLGYNTNPKNKKLKLGTRNIKMTGKKGPKGQDDILLPYNIGWSVTSELTSRKDKKGEEIPGSELEHTPAFEEPFFKHMGISEEKINRKLNNILNKEIVKILWQVMDVNFLAEPGPKILHKQPAKKCSKATRLIKIKRLYREITNGLRDCNREVRSKFDQELQGIFTAIAYEVRSLKGVFGEPVYNKQAEKSVLFLPEYKFSKNITSTKDYCKLDFKKIKLFIKEVIKYFKDKYSKDKDLGDYRFLFEAFYRKYEIKRQNYKGIDIFSTADSSVTEVKFPNDPKRRHFNGKDMDSLAHLLSDTLKSLGIESEKDVIIFDSNTNISFPDIEAKRFFQKEWPRIWLNNPNRITTKEDCYEAFCKYMDKIQDQCLSRKDGLALAYVYEYFKNNLDVKAANENLKPYIEVMRNLMNCMGTPMHEEMYRLVMDIDNIELSDGSNLSTKSLYAIMEEFDIKPENIMFMERNVYSGGLHVFISTKELINYDRAKKIEDYINNNLKVEVSHPVVEVAMPQPEQVPVRVEICKFYNNTQFLRFPLSFEYMPAKIILEEEGYKGKYIYPEVFIEDYLITKPTEIPYTTAKFRETIGVKKKKGCFAVDEITRLELETKAALEEHQEVTENLTGKKRKNKMRTLPQKVADYQKSLEAIGTTPTLIKVKRSRVVELEDQETGESLGYILTTSNNTPKGKIKLKPYQEGKRFEQMKWEVPYLKVGLGLTLYEVAHSIKERAGTSKDLNAWSEDTIMEEIKEYYNKCNYWNGPKNISSSRVHSKDMLVSNLKHFKNGEELLDKIIYPNKQSDNPAPADILYEAWWENFKKVIPYNSYKKMDNDKNQLRAKFHRECVLPIYFLEMAGLAIDSLTNVRITSYKFKGLIPSRNHFNNIIRTFIRGIIYNDEELKEAYTNGIIDDCYRNYIIHLRKVFRKDFLAICEKNNYQNTLEFECDYVFGKLVFDPSYYQKFMASNVFNFLPYAKEGKNKAYYDLRHAITYHIPSFSYIQKQIDLALLKICQGTRYNIKCKDMAIAHKLTSKVFLNDESLEQDIKKDSKEHYKIYKECRRYLKENCLTKDKLFREYKDVFVSPMITNDNQKSNNAPNLPEYVNNIYQNDPKANTKLGKALANLCLIASFITLSFTIQENCIPFSYSQISTDKQERYIMYQTSINPPDLIPGTWEYIAYNQN